VIINIHHDGHTENNGDSGWLSINKARASEEGKQQVTAQFERVWVHHEYGLTPIYWDNGVFSGSGENAK